jgi:hypothetical protein
MTIDIQKVDTLLDTVSERVANYRGDAGRKATSLLADVHLKVSVVRQAKQRFARELAPDFRIFDYLRTDENGLSRCLAALLDPHGSHGQRQTFLKAFLGRMPTPVAEAMEDETVRVHLEHPTPAGRRIDVLLESPSALIGIENKPWAADQDRQLSDYADYLQQAAGQNRPWVLVFVSNRDPSNESLTESQRQELEEANRFVMMSYHQLNDWLDECAGQCRALTVRVFIEELEKFIRGNINGEIEMSESEEVVKSVLESPERLESAFLIAGSLDEVKRQLIPKLREQLEEECEKRKLILDWNPANMNGQKYSGFAIYCRDSTRVGVGFDFECGSFNCLAWGVYRDDKNTDDSEFDREEINKRMENAFGVGKKSKNWFWFNSAGSTERLGQELQDWAANPKPWLRILDGTLAPKIAELGEQVCQLFKDKPELLVGKIER